MSANDEQNVEVSVITFKFMSGGMTDYTDIGLFVQLAMYTSDNIIACK